MTGTLAFLKKELRETWSTHRLYVILAIFVLIGFTSPLLAKMAPDILGSMAKDSGLSIQIPPPTAVDAYSQLFKNLNNLGTLAVIFSLIGLVVDEKMRGSAIMMITKPVPRWAFITSKYVVSAGLVLLSTALSYAACLYYTLLIFHETHLATSLAATLLAMIFYLLVLALTLLASTVGRSLALSGGIAIAGVLLLSLLPQLNPWLAHYSPGALIGYQAKLVEGSVVLADTLPAVGITLALTVVLVALSVLIFGRQEL
ncbi:MAG: ABC transporter permease subunit [Clostridia bacterium]|nr:ABC transporter permease subunit [Clostridia bacterium]